jgi:Werner syndrome ATP-dependent helicase
VAEYLPTVEQKECYEVVEVERVVTAPTPQQPPKNPTVTKLENVLYQHLLVFRNDLARDVQIAPFLVCSNGLLADLARARPQTLESMKTVEGVSEVWLQKYGDKFLETIGSFCGTRDVDVPMDAHLSAASTQPQSAPTIVKEKLVKGCQIVGALTDIIMTSYSAFTQEKLSMEEIMKRRSLTGSTVLGHLAKALEMGYFVDYRRAGLTAELEDTITNAIRREPIFSNVASLRLIKDQLPDDVAYGHIYLAIAVLKIKTGYVSSPQSTARPTLSTPSHSSTTSTSPSAQLHTSFHASSQAKKRKLPFAPGNPGRNWKRSRNNKTGKFW